MKKEAKQITANILEAMKQVDSPARVVIEAYLEQELDELFKVEKTKLERRVKLIKSEPNGIVRETMINGLLN